jgi:hypothetical protein
MAWRVGGCQLLAKRLLSKLIRLPKNLYRDFENNRIMYLEVGRPHLPPWVERVEKVAESTEVVSSGNLTQIAMRHYFPERWIYMLKNVTLEPASGDIFSPTGQLIFESTNWHSYFPNPFRRRKRIRESRISNGFPFIYLPASGYFHFLIEDLPSFLATRYIYPQSDVLVARESPQYLIDVLEILGINPILVNSHVGVSELILSSKGRDSGWARPQDINILRDTFRSLGTEFKPESILYISRKKSLRSPRNESQLIEVLEENGVEIVFAEDMSMHQQIVKFSSARLLIGLHGAGLSNQVWMKPGMYVLEILDKAYFNICFEALAKVSGLNYESITFDTSNSDSGIPTSDVVKSVENIKAKMQ